MTVATLENAHSSRESIRVCVRVRPPSPQELEGDRTFTSERRGVVIVDAFRPDRVLEKDHDDTSTLSGYLGCAGTQMIALQPGGDDRTFVVDRVFDIDATQQEVREN